VTQLVVRRGYRERGVATGMLRRLGEEVERKGNGEVERKGVDVWGVASCNPAAVLAVGGAFGGVLAFFGPSSRLSFSSCHLPRLLPPPSFSPPPLPSLCPKAKNKPRAN
jgi:hypothetical protein